MNAHQQKELRVLTQLYSRLVELRGGNANAALVELGVDRLVAGGPAQPSAGMTSVGPFLSSGSGGQRWDGQ